MRDGFHRFTPFVREAGGRALGMVRNHEVVWACARSSTDAPCTRETIGSIRFMDAGRAEMAVAAEWPPQVTVRVIESYVASETVEAAQR
jgi:hypothetical protein